MFASYLLTVSCSLTNINASHPLLCYWLVISILKENAVLIYFYGIEYVTLDNKVHTVAAVTLAKFKYLAEVITS